uniref:(California timema) hypothetical protein n=1 Tax=Timema californicum TaxID=61474 RepID=A0A7R9J236_TIMCA|nr:unnamed protein product [Timema californicum]
MGVRATPKMAAKPRRGKITRNSPTTQWDRFYSGPARIDVNRKQVSGSSCSGLLLSKKIILLKVEGRSWL